MVSKKKFCFLSLFGLISFFTLAQEIKVEPMNWWVGMKNPNLQLLVRGNQIQGSQVVSLKKELQIKKVTNADSPNYLFVDLVVTSSTKPGLYPLQIKRNGRVIETINYKLEEREKGSAKRSSYSTKDVIYLITPDRFANGNKENDQIKGMSDNSLNRNALYDRHGGDLRGIINHLDYIKDMGFTAVWNMPVMENNQKMESYHGYGITNYYQVDPRFGTNEDYRELGKKLRDQGMYLIQDIVLNHCGDGHWWMKDMPFKDWINFGGKFVSTTHRRETVQDPHVSMYDAKLQTEGWFVPAMPDLNQKNTYLQNYLIQNTIWWIEYAHLGGLRIDTYPYSTKEFATKWSDAILAEYPNLNMVGEEWSTNPIITSYWQKGKYNRDGFKSSLPALMDFPLQNAITEAFNESDKEWGKGLNKIYNVIASDLIYANPDNLVVFGDNHDMSRIFTQLKHDPALLKMAMTYLFTTRGIPQVFYGTEISMSNPKSNEHGEIRGDFPGGWEGDEKNGFTGKNLTKEEKEMQDFFRKILHWRKQSDAIHHGKLLHFGPENAGPANGIYVFFRYTNSSKVMIILNKNKEERTLDLTHYREILPENAKGFDVMENKKMVLGNMMNLPAKSSLILEIN